MIVTKRVSMASLIRYTSPVLRHSLQQSHNKGLYYGFRDAILFRLVTIINATAVTCTWAAPGQCQRKNTGKVAKQKQLPSASMRGARAQKITWVLTINNLLYRAKRLRA